MIRLRWQLLWSVCLTSFVIVPLSYAQQSSGGGSAAPASDHEIARIEEIIVTAQRRTENLQNVPIAVSTISAEDAAKLGNTGNMSLGTQVPSFQSSRQITGATLYVRGVGGISGPGNENAVATYIDDVYINGVSGTVVQFNNIDHVEVLKGPQGTLFGRNATAGVINIVTKDPSQITSLNAQVGFGNYQTITTNVYGTTGLGKNLALDIAYESREQRQGYGHNLTTGNEILLGKEYGIRSKLKWTPGENTTVLLNVGHYWDDYDYGASANVAPNTLSVGNATFAGNYNSQGLNSLSTDGEEGHSVHVDDASLRIDHNLGWAGLRSISATRRYTDSLFYDQDMGPLHIVDVLVKSNYEQYSEELHLFSPDGAKLAGRDIHWLAGLFVLKMHDAITPLGVAGAAVGGLTNFGAFSTADTNSYSVFADATYSVTSNTSLTLGLRETDDRIRNSGRLQFDTGIGGTTVLPAPDQHANYKKLTYRAVLDHKFTDSAMAYASVSRGFKAGGFSLFAENTPPVGPEILDAYALGAKTDWLDDRLQVNVEAFDYEYKNQQVQVINQLLPIFINAAQSRIYGLDAALTAAPTRALTLRANFGYLHGRYQDFRNAPIFVQNPATCAPVPTRLPGPLQPGATTCSFDATGYRTIRSPTFSGNVSADYLVKTALGDFDLAANVYHTKSFAWDPSGQYPEPAYTLLNAAVTWTTMSGKFNVQLYCDNCGNRYTNMFIAESAPSMQRAANSPRLLGVRIGARM